jgi:chorismate-pyruvate lyase
MSNIPAKPTPDARQLMELFYDDPSSVCDLSQVAYEQVPEPYQTLLVHNAHMTVAVESHHKTLVSVEVLDINETDEHYSRKILLRRITDDVVVQFGVVRLHHQLIPQVAWKRIRNQEAPLGRILIEQNVMRTVELVGTWKCTPSQPLADIMQLPLGLKTYGRTALIHVNEEPAIELFEVIARLKS